MHYVIIGANAAGLSAAMRILKYQPHAKISVYEAAEVISFGACGMPYYIAGEFDDIEIMTARPLKFFQQKGMAIYLKHQAVQLDAKNKLLWLTTETKQQQSIRYDKLLIATGARPKTLPIQLDSTGDVYYFHEKQDAIALKARLPTVHNIVIVGGGFIGLEMVEALVTQGKQVTLLQGGSRVLNAQFDSEMSQLLAGELQRHKVSLQLEESVIGLVHNSQGGLTEVIGNKGRYLADILLVAIGVQPNSDFLIDSGIALNQQGAVIIDEFCQTSLPDVYAAGDCATVPHILIPQAYLPLATTANKLGRLAGETMTGQTTSFIGTLGASGIRLFGLEAGRVGLTEQQAQEAKLPYATVWVKDKNHTDYIAGQSDMWIKLIYRTDNRVIIGAQLCGQYGSGAVHRIDALSIGIMKQLTIEELRMQDFVYAPPFSRPWDILNIAANVAQ